MPPNSSQLSAGSFVQPRSKLACLIKLSGFFGALAVGTGTLISSLTYTSEQGYPYSFFNQFISELGEVGIAANAWAFNLGLILGGFCLLVFNLALGLQSQGKLAKLAMVVGAGAAISLSMIGVYPMNSLEPHTLAAMTYFRLTLLTILLFTIVFIRLPKNRSSLPVWINGFSVLALGFYASFLVVVQFRAGELDLLLDPGSLPSRPDFWLTPMLEWGIFFSTLLWILMISLKIRCRA